MKYSESHKKANKRYYLKNHERIKQYHIKYRIENKEKIKEYGKKLRQRPEYIERIKKWRGLNALHLKQTSKKYRDEHKEEKRIIDKNYHLRNRERILLKQRLYRDQYRIENKEKIRDNKRKYNLSDKGKICSTRYVHKRLARLHNSKFNLTPKETKQLFEEHKCCEYCGNKDNLTLDHIVPLSKNGETNIKNIAVSCKRCNSSKGDKNVFEWCAEYNLSIPDKAFQITAAVV